MVLVQRRSAQLFFWWQVSSGSSVPKILQETQILSTNYDAWLTSQKHIPPDMCYRSKFGRSVLKCVGINTGEPTKLGNAETALSLVWQAWDICEVCIFWTLPTDGDELQGVKHWIAHVCRHCFLAVYSPAIFAPENTIHTSYLVLPVLPIGWRHCHW